MSGAAIRTPEGLRQSHGEVVESHAPIHGEKNSRGYRGSPLSAYTKLGLFAICVLSISLSLIIGSLAFLWFLWLADARNRTWRQIADRNWVTRAISLSSLAIRQSISFQASVATAMVASLVLEQGIILLLNLASVSTTRNANGGPYMLFWWLWKAFFFNRSRWRTFYWPIVITLLASTTSLTHLTSFVLLSDLDLVIVQAEPNTRNVPTHFEYNSNGTIPIVTHGSTWSQSLQSYVSFAEYHEDSAYEVPDGVVDTGPTLRAFLPILDQQSRSMVSGWDGIAMVLDSRSVCVRPELLQPRIHYADTSIALNTGFSLNVPRPSDMDLIDLSNNYSCSDGVCPGQTVCMLPLRPLTDTGTTLSDPSAASQWRLVICQPTGVSSPFILQSELQTRGNDQRRNNHTGDPNYSFGNAYLVVNVSSGSEDDWAANIPGEDPNSGIFRGEGTSPLAYGVHGQNNEWYDLIFSEDGALNLSVSVCYTAFDIADLHVKIDSRLNHSDIQPTWNKETSSFDYHVIRAQFGQELNGSVTYSNNYENRNIMHLQKRDSWIPEPDFGDYVVPWNRITQTNWITDYANMGGSLQSNVFNYAVGANQARFMWQGYQLNGLWSSMASYDYADASLRGLVQEILQSGGSLSFAMQSIVTSLTQLAYYQQLQQLNGASNVTSSPYVVATAPTQKRGIVAVTIVICVHVFIVFCLILPAFLLRTEISTIGNAWQTVAQVLDLRVSPILNKARLATDTEAEKEVKVPTGKKQKLKNHEIVGLHSPDGQNVYIMDGFVKNSNEDAAGYAITAIEDHRKTPTQELIVIHSDEPDDRTNEQEREILLR